MAKAKKIYETDNGLGYNYLYYISETLYCKKTGEYFLHGDGGADYTNKVMTISIRQKVIDKVKREAQKRDMSVSKLIEDLIESI